MPAQTVIKLRRDTAANWTSVDPVLAAGEAGFESDNNRIKIGDGTSTWSQLSYASGGGGVAIDDTAPTDTESTPLWWDTASGTLFIYYDGFWVEAVVGVIGPQGPQGETGDTGIIQAETEPAATDVLWLDTDEPGDAVLPLGGTTGQVLSKIDGSDYNTEWVDLTASDLTDVTASAAELNILDGATVTTAELNTLDGVTSPIQSQLNNRPVSHNYIINGAFDIWQRGTSFSSTGSFVFTADRHGIGSPGDSTTLTQQVFTPADIEAIGFGDAEFYARFGIVSQNGGARFVVGNVEDVRTLAGQEVTLSFWARSSDITVLRTQSRQSFGTGGSAAVTGPNRDVTLSSSWQRYSFTSTLGTMAGKTIGPNSFLAFWIFPESATETGSVDFWGVQLEAGSVATPFKRHAPSLQGELAACQRYYYRLTPNATGTRFGLALVNLATEANAFVTYPVRMRIAPTGVEQSGTTTDYNIVTASGNVAITSVPSHVIATTDNAVVRLTDSGSTLTAGQAAYMRANSTNAFLGWSAEL